MREQRRSPRYLCSHIVEILWPEPAGGVSLWGLLEDLGREGAAVSVDAPVPPGEIIELTAPGLRVRARVCYCKPRENDFQLGLEFADGWTWDPEQWRPDHLFLPPGSP